MTIEDIQQNHDFAGAITNDKSYDIKVIGVGGGGNNAINHMYKQGIKNVSFVVCNTDRQALNNSPVPNRLLLGDGLGAGNKPEVARKAAEEGAERINALFDDKTKMVFITAGMGGGTGTGAAPVVARIAKERGLLTIGIVTIPFLFEGEKKILKALDGAEEMGKYVDALLVINNDRLTEIYRDLDFLNAFGKADDTLTIAARSISELITSDGFINLDFNDVDTTLRNGGAAIISSGYGEGENRVTKAINDALNSPLLKNRDIMGSKKILFNIYFSRNAEKKFQMGEADELTSFMNNIDNGVDVIWGVGFDDTLGDKVKITILAAGFEVSIRDDNKNTGTSSVLSAGAQSTISSRVVGVYDAGKISEINRNKNRKRYIILSPDQMDDDETISSLESPTLNRNKKLVGNDTNISFGNPAPETVEAKEPATPASAAPQSTGNPKEISFM